MADHYRVSDISVNKVGAVVCLTDELLDGTRTLEQVIADADRLNLKRKGMLARKRQLKRSRCRYCGESRTRWPGCRCE